MKQSFYAIGMFMLIVSGQASAQTSETSFITRGSVLSSPFVTAKAAPVADAKVSVTALEKFRKDYKDAKNVEWVEVPTGYRAYFLNDAVLTAVDYTKKGKLYSVIRYGKELLPPYIKMKLEQTYDGPQIREVTEVKIADFASKAYVVVLEDRTSLRTIQIIDDEISVIHEIQK
jgi:hypothetical protein